MFLTSLTLLALLLLLASILPVFPYPHGIFRVFDFPRLQVTSLALLLLLSDFIFLQETDSNHQIAFILGITLLLQLPYMLRFTPLWRKRSLKYKEVGEKAATIRLLIANVKQSNRAYDRLSDLIRKLDPDIVVLLETDRPWIEALQETVNTYPYRFDQPQDNAYGMMLVSRFPLREGRIRFLLNDEVPSIDTLIDHPDGKTFRLFAVHPEPPLIHADTVGRDAEIACVGKLVRQDDIPVIVCGDLNDVAWSATTRRFLRISQLLDPREGRGFFNTFDARYFFIRWPLDHIFHSPHFRLIAMERQAPIGSDHFPMYYKLALGRNASLEQSADKMEKTDLAEANELIREEADRERRPAGHDWEK